MQLTTSVNEFDCPVNPQMAVGMHTLYHFAAIPLGTTTKWFLSNWPLVLMRYSLKRCSEAMGEARTTAYTLLSSSSTS